MPETGPDEHIVSAIAALTDLLQHRRAHKPRTPTTYLIAADDSPLVKIGYTGGDPMKRLAGLQTGQPATLRLVRFWPGDYERALHRRFAQHRKRGEWFDLRPLGDPVQVVQAAVNELQVESVHADVIRRLDQQQLRILHQALGDDLGQAA